MLVAKMSHLIKYSLTVSWKSFAVSAASKFTSKHEALENGWRLKARLNGIKPCSHPALPKKVRSFITSQ